MRIHVVIPDELLKDIDELAGKRGRSRFIAEAAKARAYKEVTLKVLREGAGSIDASKHPEWGSTEKVARWIRELRDTPTALEKSRARLSARRKRPDRLVKRKAAGT